MVSISSMLVIDVIALIKKRKKGFMVRKFDCQKIDKGQKRDFVGKNPSCKTIRVRPSPFYTYTNQQSHTALK